MEIDRRGLIGGISALAATSAVPRANRSAHAGQDTVELLYAAARRAASGAYSAQLVTAGGRDIRTVSLPARGHDATFCPVTRRCVMFARRPGNFAVAFSADGAEPALRFSTPENRHFYGHGVFSRDGRLLYATENDFESGRGVIGIYDARAHFSRIGEFPSHGIGPHDMALLRHSPVLVIANGGLLEHPDIGGGRRVLNSDRVVTSLVYVDVASGDLLERHELGRPAAVSLRHLDLAADDTVVLGGQALRKGDPHSALIFRHRRQRPLETVAITGAMQSALHGYVSSIATDKAGHITAISSSRGGVVLMLDVASRRVVGTIRRHDVSGVARANRDAHFMLTSGDGDVMTVGADGTAHSRAHGTGAWDNHVAAG